MSTTHQEEDEVQQSDRRPRPITGWAEQDAYTKWRRMYCYLQRAGSVKGIKRMTHRRERRAGKREVEEQLLEHPTPEEQVQERFEELMREMREGQW
jgi:hypothetical protein